MICSIIRFVSLVEHKATTYPTFDPTWYGATAIVLSILEVDIATIMASLPVFWPYLRRNIDRIMITHEIEVKVTENFTQLEDDGGSGGGGRGAMGSSLGHRRYGSSVDGGRRSEHAAYTPWVDGASGAETGGGNNNKVGTNVVMMRDLGRAGTEESEISSGLPFDGTQNAGVRSPSRSHFLTRESKEILLRS